MTELLAPGPAAGTGEAVRIGTDTLQWPVWSTFARVVVTEPGHLDGAARIVAGLLAEVDAAASRFRTDSEINAVHGARGRPVAVSPLLADLVATALAAAENTDGDVDPTLGAALAGLGYDRDVHRLDRDVSGPLPAPGPRDCPAPGPATTDPGTTDPGTTDPGTTDPGTTDPGTTDPGTGVPGTGVPGFDRIAIAPAPNWRRVRLVDGVLTVPAGTVIDLGATAKAWTADRAAALVAESLGTGVLVSLGGDIATAGPAPAGGWQIRVQDTGDEPGCGIALPAGAAIATSSTLHRRWRHGERAVHHILNPRTLRPADPVWRTVTIAARTCVEANTLTTAAMVRGETARPWLNALGLPARLVRRDGAVLATGSWPAPTVPEPSGSHRPRSESSR